MQKILIKNAWTVALLFIAICSYGQASRDITALGGNLRVMDKNGANVTDHPAGEAPRHMIDNNGNTKFLIFNFNNYKPVIMIFEPTDPAVVDQYILAAANDAPDRDPREWTIEGSDDMGTWVVLDTRSNESFSDRFQQRTFNFTNTRAFKYYAFRLINNNGGNLFQLGEWRLLKRAGPPPPDKLKAKALSESSIELTWTNNAPDALSLIIQRSLDGVNFEQITSLPITETRFVDEGLEKGAGYYYRLYVTSNTVNSDFSLVAGAMTKTDMVGPPRPVANNVLTPNGDNINDRWVISNLDKYPRHHLVIFDRSGRPVFETREYKNDWDGTSNGRPLPEGTYFFVMKFWPGIEDLRGTITLIRSSR